MNMSDVDTLARKYSGSEHDALLHDLRLLVDEPNTEQSRLVRIQHEADAKLEGEKAVELAKIELVIMTHELNQRFTFGGDDFDSYCIPSGEEFIALLSGGPMVEISADDIRIPCRCFSWEVAVQLLRDAIERYIDGRTSGTIYWRRLPELRCWYHYHDYYREVEQHGSYERNLYSAYCRLLII